MPTAKERKRSTGTTRASSVSDIVKRELDRVFGPGRVTFVEEWGTTEDGIEEPVLNISVRLTSGERPEVSREVALLPITIREALEREGHDVLVHVWFPDDEVAAAAD